MKFSRRDFLRTSALAGAGALAASLPGNMRVFMQDGSIRLMAWGNPTEFEAREATIAMFEESFPDITVEFLHTPDDYGTKLQTMLAGGDYPDVFFLGNGDVAPYAARNQLLPIDELIAADNVDTSDIFPANLALYNVDGVQYGFPVDAPTQQLFFNRTMFEEAGVEPPISDWEDMTWNREAFLERALAIADPANNRWAFQVKPRNFRAWWVWVKANGGEFYNEDGTECVLNQPETVEALQFLADLIHIHGVAPTLDISAELGQNEMFEAGLLAMDTWWPAMGRMRSSIADKFVWDVAPHPAGDVGKAAAGGGTGHVIHRNAPNPEAAWEFLKFVISTPAVERWTEIMGIVPPLQSVAATDVYLQPGNPPEHINVFTEASPYLVIDPQHPTFVQARSITNAELDRLWIGEATAQEVCDSMVDQINRLL